MKSAQLTSDLEKIPGFLTIKRVKENEVTGFWKGNQLEFEDVASATAALKDLVANPLWKRPISLFYSKQFVAGPPGPPCTIVRINEVHWKVPESEVAVVLAGLPGFVGIKPTYEGMKARGAYGSKKAEFDTVDNASAALLALRDNPPILGGNLTSICFSDKGKGKANGFWLRASTASPEDIISFFKNYEGFKDVRITRSRITGQAVPYVMFSTHEQAHAALIDIDTIPTILGMNLRQE